MNPRKSLTVLLAVSLIALILPAAAMAQAVSTECAFTTTGGANGFGDVYCEIYVDATGGLISGGVMLSSTNLTVSSATKNTARWFFGDVSPGIDYPNSPDISDPVNPVVLVGHYDTSASPTVVDGAREFIGAVTFDRTDDTAPVVNPQLGRGGDYVNFVAVDGAPLDGSITFNAALVHERGDANGVGGVTPSDMIAIRNFFYLQTPLVNSVAADCNGVGGVTPADMICVRNKFYGL